MRRRIVVCLALLLALCLLGDAIAMLCLRTSIGELSAVAEAHRIQSLRAELASSGVRIERDLLATTGGEAADESLRQKQLDSLRRFEESVAACAGCHHDQEIQARLNRLNETFQIYRDRVVRAAEAVAGNIGAGNIGAGDIGADRETQELADELVVQSTEMADLASAHLMTKSSAAAASVHRAWLVLLGSICVSLVVGGLVAFHLKRRMTAPLEALLEGIEQVREGDVNRRFEIAGDEEFRRLGQAFNRAHESLQRAHDGILQAEKMAAVGKMAAGVAHEVGNPLASISSVVQMMRRECGSEKERERLDLIMHHIGRVSQIVRELLTFTRPVHDSGGGRVELNRLLDETVSLLRYDKRAKHARIVCHYDAGLVLERGDADRLLLVFTNIVINAFDAMSACRNGDAQLEITAFQTDAKVVLRFADNGPGMSPDQVRNAFEPFYTTKEPGAGTGLGLWICYQVVRKHGGDIRIESQPGEGAVVIIELPRRPPADEAAATPRMAERLRRSFVAP